MKSGDKIGKLRLRGNVLKHAEGILGIVAKTQIRLFCTRYLWEKYLKGKRNMEQIANCKLLTAVFEADNLRLDAHILKFDTIGKERFHIEIEQFVVRKITIATHEDVVVYDLYAVLTRVERILMLFDGVFIPLKEICFSDSDTVETELLNLYGDNLAQSRLSYFISADFCSYRVDRLLEFDKVLTAGLFEQGVNLIHELDIVHQMYLYSMSNSKITVDVKCAFLIELAEPLIEIVKEHTKFFSSLFPGSHGTSLKNCLDALITKYGEDIFKRELSGNYEQFLSALVNSRVRIMHIKRKRSGVYFEGNESVLYIMKMSLLYRKIMLEVLDIDESYYRECLLKNVSRINQWNGVLEKLLSKLS